MTVSPSREKMLLSVGYTRLDQYLVTSTDLPRGSTVSVFTYIPRPPRIIGVAGLAPYGMSAAHDYRTVNPADLVGFKS